MSIDLSKYHKHNITDTCAVWNVLSSQTLYASARCANVCFYCTQFVIYECLHKRRQTDTAEDIQLQIRLRQAQDNNDFKSYPIDIADLQTIDILEKRQKLGKGELSSIALAQKTRQAFLTDDQGARKLAKEFMDSSLVQTTPHLLGWLFFASYLVDGERDIIVNEHSAMQRPLGKYFREMYERACEYRLMANTEVKRND